IAFEYSAIVFPFCSSAIVRAVKFALGALAVTSTAPVWPTNRSGLVIVIPGGAPRPATTYAIEQPRMTMTTRTPSARSIGPIQSQVVLTLEVPFGSHARTVR